MEKLLQNIDIYNEDIRIAFDLSPSFIFFKDINNNVIWVNEAMTQTYGFTKQEFYDFFNNSKDLSDETIAKYIKDDLYVYTTGLPLYDIEEKLYKNPIVKWMKTSKFPCKDADGKIIGLIGFSYDITKIRETSLEFETLINSIPETIMLFDHSGLCLKVYPGKHNMWVHPAEIMVGKNINDMIYNSTIIDNFNLCLERLKKDNTTIQQFEYTNKENDIDYYYDALMTAFNGGKIMVILRDVTDRKKLDIFQSFNHAINELTVYNQKILTTLGINNGQ